MVQWTDVALCLSFVACWSVHIKTSSRLRCRDIPILDHRALITAMISISGLRIKIVYIL